MLGDDSPHCWRGGVHRSRRGCPGGTGGLWTSAAIAVARASKERRSALAVAVASPTTNRRPPGPITPPRDRSRPPMFRPAVLVTAVVLIAGAAAASGAVLFTALTRRMPNRHGTRPSRPSHCPAQDASAAAPDGTLPAQGPSDTSPDSAGAGAVTVGTGASQDTDASSVADFLGQYFAAINARDYQSYFSLLSPGLQQDMTQAQFRTGTGPRSTRTRRSSASHRLGRRHGRRGDIHQSPEPGGQP